MGIRSRLLLLVGLVCCWVMPERALGASVPIEIQAALFKKIIQYDLALQKVPPASFRLLVLEGGDAVASAFTKGGVNAKVVTAAELPAEIGKANAVYVVSTLDPAAAKLCVEYKVLSFGGTAAVAERGEASVGLGLRNDGKPEIVIHWRRLQTEGHNLPAGVLSLARVIR